jgi:hypothetical protein
VSRPDNNYRSHADIAGLVLSGEQIDPRLEGKDPAEFDDLLKLSHVTNATVRGCAIRGGGAQRENALDLNRQCADVLIDGCTLESGRQNALTIKGGCVAITVKDTVIVPGRGHCDIELGNWSDQSTARTTRVWLVNVTRSDGRPVRLRVGRADDPIVLGGNVRKDRLGSLLITAAWWAKYLFTRSKK